MSATSVSSWLRASRVPAAVLLFGLLMAAPAVAQQQETIQHQGGGEASLVLPDLTQVQFLGVSGRTLLTSGLGVSALGLLFGLVIYRQIQSLPVHRSMLEISELIYE